LPFGGVVSTTVFCRSCGAALNVVGAGLFNNSSCYQCWQKERGPKTTLPGSSREDRLASFAARLKQQLAEAQTPQARKALEDKLRALGQEVGGKSPLKTTE
jgi:hypothetical protein